MLQQTGVTTVIPKFAMFTRRWPDFAALAAAEDVDLMAAWAGLGYYARARNLVACAKAVVRDHGGEFPTTETELLTLPGIGGYTAAAIAAIAFGARAVVVDANVERVVGRLFAIDTPLPGGKPEIYRAADSITPDTRSGDFAQAMMDLGTAICTPRNPRCLACPIRADCAGFASGDPQAYPVKAAKKLKPQRYGTIFWVEAGDQVLLVTRPDKGLLGGMRALPTGPWADAPPGLADAPIAADWTLLPGTVTHVFTHFRLELALAVGRGVAQTPGTWWPVVGLATAGLPTVFAKAADAIRREM